MATETFEGGSLPSGWTTPSGATPWEITTSSVHSGTYALKAGAIADNGRSAVQVTFTSGEGNLTFWRRVSSEGNYDWLRVFVDGVQQGQWSGEQAWAQITIALTAGTHLLEWRYTKDGSSASGSDTAWIDDVSWPDSGVTGILSGDVALGNAALTGLHIAGNLTATLDGVQPSIVAGNLTGTLNLESAALTGLHIAGPLAGTLNLGAFTADAGHGVAGTLTGTLAAVTATAAGFAPITATLTATLSTLTGVGDGRVLVAGSCTATLTGVRGSGVGVVAPLGTVTGTLTGLRGQAQAVHLTGTLTGRLAELGASFRVIAAPPRPAERRSPWAYVGSVPPQTLLGPLDDAPGLTLPLISIGAIRRPADGSESANTTLTLDNGDGAVALAWAIPPLLAPITVYAPTGAVWFSGVITGLTVAETVTLTVEG